MKNNQRPFLVLTALLFTGSVSAVHAGTPVKCQKRLSPARSSVSVNIEGLKPLTPYVVNITSGPNSVQPVIATDGFGVLEMDADSNRRDILAGATPIGARFISINPNDQDVKVVVSNGIDAPVSAGADCRVR